MECKSCELCEQCKAPVLGAAFSSLNENASEHKDVMIVGDFPHEWDIKSTKPLSGPIGTELAKLLHANNIAVKDVYVTNLLKCRPLAPNGLDGRPKKAHVDACQMYLVEEIANVTPKVIIILGEFVFRYFYPDAVFTDSRGKVMKTNMFDIPTVATYHPMAMLATSKFDQIIQKDFSTACAVVTNKPQKFTKGNKDYRLITKSLDLLEKVAKRVKQVETFAFDIETHGEGLFNYKLLSIGLSWKKDTGVSIPVYVLDEQKVEQITKAISYEPPERYKEETVTLKNGKQKIKQTKIKGWLKEDTESVINMLPEEYKGLIASTDTKREIKSKLEAILDKEPPLKRYWGDQHDRCMALIKEIMECETPKGAHNGAYDVNRLRGKGILVKNYSWDTILMHHMIDEERPHGLDDLSFVYTADGGYKSEKNQYLKSSKTSWANIPMDVLLPYNAQDADVTFQLYHIFKEKIYKEPKRIKLFEQHIMPAQRMLCDMEFRGSHIDVEWVKKTRAEYIEKMRELKIEFSQIVGKFIPNVYVIDSPDEQKEITNQIKAKAEADGVEPVLPKFLNMNSTQHLIELFRDYCGVKLTKKTKSGDALDADVLKKIAKKNKAAEVLLEYKKLKKLESTYLSSTLENIDADGKLHTEFLLYGTTTSRLSSRNPNMQNVSSSMKTMFIPPSKDYLCVNVDQSAAELHVLSALSQDRKMIACFEEHRDLHRETASAVFNKKPEDITDQERKIAKRCFSADSFILTEDGYIRGKDIGNRKVYTLDGKLQNQHHVYEERDGLKITLRNGMNLRVTPDHKFMDFSHVVPTWKQANEFKVGDVIGTLKSVVPLKPVYLENEYKIGTHSSRFPNKIELDADLAYLMGIYLGDGSMLFDRRGDAAQVQLVIKRGSRTHILNNLASKFPISSKKDFGTYSLVVITSKEIAQLFYKHLGYTKTKHVPDAIFKCDKSIVNHFISGLMDSDGTTSRGIIRFRNTNENMVRGLCQLATLNGYTVTYGTEKYDTTIKMNKDPNKRYTGIMHICTFVNKPNLTLFVENKKEGLQRKNDTNETNRWFINKEECMEAVPNRGHDIAWANYRDGHMKGLTDAVVTKWGFEHKNYWAQEIIKIEPDHFDTLIMETDTHFFVGNAVRNPNCNFGVSYGVSGKGLVDLLEPEGVKITENQGNKFIEKWRNTYKYCARYLDNASKTFARYGYLETPFGRRRHKYKHYADASREASDARKACNFPIQSTASDIQLYEMIHMYKTLVDNGVLPVLTVHDSIVMYCPKDKLKWLRDYYHKETCRRFPNEEFPGLNNCLMYTEMEVGRNYGEHVKLPYDCDFEKWKEENKFLFE